jgi:hypothetical protein
MLDQKICPEHLVLYSQMTRKAFLEENYGFAIPACDAVGAYARSSLQLGR